MDISENIDSNQTEKIVIETIEDFNKHIEKKTNGTWLIKKPFELDGNKTLPSGVTLEFSGSNINFSKYNLTGNNSRIIAKEEEIFKNVGKLEGTWSSQDGYFDWFGAKGDGVKSDSQALENALNSTFQRLKGTIGKEYLLDRSIKTSSSKDIIINLNGSTLNRNSKFLKNEPAIVVPKSSYQLKISNGYIKDNSNLLQPFILATANKSVEISNLNCQSNGNIFKGYNCDNVIIKDNFLESLAVTPLNGSYLCSLNSAKNVSVLNNTIINTHTGIYVQAIGSERTDVVEVKNNKIFKTQDTGIFVRMIGTGNNAFRGAIIKENTLEDIGKAPIKFSAPKKAISGIMEKCIISHNIIKGMGRKVSSFGIGIFRGTSQQNIQIKECIVSNNIIDGFGTDEKHGVKDDIGMRGIRIDFVTNLICSNNIVRNTLSDGIYIGRSTNINGYGNIVDNCCLSTKSVGKGGVYLFACKTGAFNAVSTKNKNDADGIHIAYTREINISGNYSFNSGFGIHESANGNEGSKSGLNIYSAILKGNHKAPTKQNGENGTNSSIQINCLDDFGSRHQGDSIRRDNLASEWAFNRNVGYIYWNTSNKCIEIKGVKENSWFRQNGLDNE